MNSQLIKAFSCSRKEENELRKTPPGPERDAYLQQINFKERVYLHLARSCPAELFQPYICPVSRARYDDATYVDKLLEAIMKKVKGDAAQCELAVGKEIPDSVLTKTAALFSKIPALSASVRRVETSGNLFLVIAV